MRILVVGGGAREHALCWRLSQQKDAEVHAAPGNPGCALVAELHAVPADDVQALCALCIRLQPDLVVVGPEAPLAAGVADVLAAQGFAVFGAMAGATRVESSKAWAKALMDEVRIPTARFWPVTDEAGLRAAVAAGGLVVKADGLAAGKGVVVAQNEDEARRAGLELAAQYGWPLVVEECLTGREVSVLALCDGTHAVMLPSVQDHKRLLDGDGGPNTGGMGTLSPGTHRDRLGMGEDELLKRVHDEVMVPALAGMRDRGAPFVGALFAGVMVDPLSGSLNVLEFNARLGDPETQVLMRRLRGDLAGALLACAQGDSSGVKLQVAPSPAVCVVLAAQGYPGKVRQGDVVDGLDAAARVPGVQVFHAGTATSDGGAVKTAGGRILSVTADGQSTWQALDRAYSAAALIRWPGVQYRRDLGRSAG
jgi:phosphoribosylamine--glycine ligase